MEEIINKLRMSEGEVDVQICKCANVQMVLIGGCAEEKIVNTKL